MSLPRLHLLELNDSAWVPPSLRATIIEALSRTLAWGRILRGLVDPLARFLDATHAEEVLDLCAGAGGPAAILIDELQRAGRRTPRFVLTDLQPHVEAWQLLRERYPERIAYEPEPVDATQIPPSLQGARRPRVIINALHHFKPDLAAAILRGACEGSPGVFVAEGFAERQPLRFASFGPAGLPALWATPLVSPRDRLAKALWTWWTPVALAASLWDGVVSTMRIYTEAELRAMVAPLGAAYTWEYGTYEFAPGGRGMYFFGTKQRD